jgi:hypothetical protein
MIPNDQSDEANDDSEPTLAVDAANALRMAGTAFTPNPNGGSNGPIYLSTDGGITWKLNAIVPSQTGSTSGTGDITVRFGSSSSVLYGGILRLPDSIFAPRMNILRAPNFAAANPMDILVDQTGKGLDQPFVQAISINGKDRVYVGCNDFNAPNGKTATIYCSLDAATAPAPAGFQPIRIETRSTGSAEQDGPAIRPAVHLDGTVYAAFFGWRAFDQQTKLVTSDVVVVRDDQGGSGTNPFTALKEPAAAPGDGLAGMRVVQGRTIPWDGQLGPDRTGSDLAIAVDPKNSANVFIVWDDRVGTNDYTLHVRQSTDKGATWSANDLRTVTNAKNPGLAIDSNSRLGFLYQALKSDGTGQRWVTHFELTSDAFANRQDVILADTPATSWLGDYAYLTAVEGDFYGIFCATNTPDPANFPSGFPKYQRNIDPQAKTLRSLDKMMDVTPSLDPFFFTTRQIPAP